MDYRKIAEDALRERARIFEARKAVLESDKTEAEKREQIERMDADMDRLAAEAREAVQAGEREADLRDLSERAGALGKVRTPGADRKVNDRAQAFADGWRAVATGEARSYDFEFGSGGTLDLKRAIRALPSGVIEGVSDGTADNYAGDAGVVTPETFVAQLLESMEDTSDIVARVRKISTTGGEAMNWPRRVSKVGGTFSHVLEAHNYPSVTEGEFDLFTLNAHKFGAIAEIPEEALTDPALNIAAIVAEEMGEDLAESLAAEIFSGSILTQNLSTSIVVTNSLGAYSATPAAGAYYDALIDVQHSLRQKYRQNATWTVSDDFARVLRKIKDTEGRYIWQPAVIAGQPDLLLGKPVATEALMPDAGDGALGVLYGDLNRFYVLRNVRNVTVRRSDEYGFNRDTVALKITWRGDGGVTDPQALASASFDPAG